MHLLIRVIRGRVFYHRDLVAKLSGKTNGGLHARVRYEPDDDELVNAMFFELQIQISVGKATGTPMLRGDNLAWFRLKLGAELTTPRAVFNPNRTSALSPLFHANNP